MTHNTSILAYRKGCMALLIQLQAQRHNNPDLGESFLSNYQNCHWIKEVKKRLKSAPLTQFPAVFFVIFILRCAQKTTPLSPVFLPLYLKVENSKLCPPPPQNEITTADASDGPASMRQDRREQPKQTKASWGCSNFDWGATLLVTPRACFCTESMFLYYILQCDWDPS